MRRAARTDGTQTAIVAALRAAGWSVYLTHTVGDGFPDLVAGKHGVTVLIECKMPGAKLTDAERKFADDWRGCYRIVYGPEQAVAVAEACLR